MTTVSLYGEAPVSPSNPDAADFNTQGASLAVKIAASVAGTYTHVGFWGALNPPSDSLYSGRIWTPTFSDNTLGDGIPVAFSEASFYPIPSTWSWLELASGGYHAAANETILASVHQLPTAGNLRYVATSHGHDAAITSGVLRAPAGGEASGLADGGTWFQGSYKYAGRNFYPNETFNNGQYFIDVRFVPDSVEPEQASGDSLITVATAGAGQVVARGSGASAIVVASSAAAYRVATASGSSALTVSSAGGATRVAQAAGRSAITIGTHATVPSDILVAGRLRSRQVGAGPVSRQRDGLISRETL